MNRFKQTKRSALALAVLLAIAGSAESAALRKAALISLMTYGQPEVGTQTVAIVETSAGDIRLAALALLASRAEWSQQLLQAASDAA